MFYEKDFEVLLVNVKEVLERDNINLIVYKFLMLLVNELGNYLIVIDNVFVLLKLNLDDK